MQRTNAPFAKEDYCTGTETEIYGNAVEKGTVSSHDTFDNWTIST